MRIIFCFLCIYLLIFLIIFLGRRDWMREISLNFSGNWHLKEPLMDFSQLSCSDPWFGRWLYLHLWEALATSALWHFSNYDFSKNICLVLIVRMRMKVSSEFLSHNQKGKSVLSNFKVSFTTLKNINRSLLSVRNSAEQVRELSCQVLE